jgi:hypothetical protein
VTDVVGTARWFMDHNSLCAEFIRGSSKDDPSAALSNLEANNRITFFNGVQFAKGGGQFAFATNRGNWTGYGSDPKRIVLGYKFFNENDMDLEGRMEGDIGIKYARVLIILHELKHYMSEVFHPDPDNPDDPMSTAAFDRGILENCIPVRRK